MIAQVLLQKKALLSEDVQVIIVPDKLVPYQDVITVYNDCVKAKYQQVAFAAAQG
jgi:biopolymer transport protein ExbD